MSGAGGGGGDGDRTTCCRGRAMAERALHDYLDRPDDVAGAGSLAEGRRRSEPCAAHSSDAPTSDLQKQRDALIIRRGLNEKFYHQQGALKVLLVFAKDDATVAALRGAAGQLGYECSLARNSSSCVDAFQSRCHDLIIVDNRDPRTLDGEAVGKALRAVKSSQYSVFVALVKRSETEKQDSSVLPYINAGYDRWMVEMATVAPFVSELLQMDASEVQPRKQLWAYHSFLLMAERSRELCIITDFSHHIVYANRALERAVGSPAKELYGRCVYDLVHVDSRERLLNAAVKGREWEGVATVAPRRNSETLMLQCRVMPNGAVGRAPANLVFMLEPPPKRGSEAGMSGRGSVPSVRRGSADMRSVCSDGLRRQSVTKLNALSIEAPITKVVTLISQAQEQSSPEVSLMLDKVVDILRTTELYSPVVREDRLRPDDPVTSDLISALLQDTPALAPSRRSSVRIPRPSRLPIMAGSSQPVPTTRRSSNDSAVTRGVHTTRSSRSVPNVSTQMSTLLETSLLWEFDIFKLEELSGQRPLLHLGMNLMEHFEVPQTLNVDMNTVHNWLSIIEMNYRATNTYHNSSHAADVMQSSAAFLERERLQRILDPLDNACCLIAAAVHDVDHPGRSSAFLCNSDHELAILYNDICVLESHHAALAFRLTVSDERVNIFKGLEKDVYKMVRLSIIDMVLATEMTKHFEHLAKFVNVFSKPVRDDDESTHLGADSDGAVMTQENIALAKRMLIKCADVSNPARPLRMCVEWALRIAEEYFQQTDEEKDRHLPVVMPMFDRASCSIPKSQIGFMDFIINDMFEAWEAFLDMPALKFYLEVNNLYWRELEFIDILNVDVDRMERMIKRLGWYGKYQPLPTTEERFPFMIDLARKGQLPKIASLHLERIKSIPEPPQHLSEIYEEFIKYPPRKIVFPTKSGTLKKNGPGMRIGSIKQKSPVKRVIKSPPKPCVEERNKECDVKCTKISRSKSQNDQVEKTSSRDRMTVRDDGFIVLKTNEKRDARSVESTSGHQYKDNSKSKTSSENVGKTDKVKLVKKRSAENAPRSKTSKRQDSDASGKSSTEWVRKKSGKCSGKCSIIDQEKIDIKHYEKSSSEDIDKPATNLSDKLDSKPTTNRSAKISVKSDDRETGKAIEKFREMNDARICCKRRSERIDVHSIKPKPKFSDLPSGKSNIEHVPKQTGKQSYTRDATMDTGKEVDAKISGRNVSKTDAKQTDKGRVKHSAEGITRRTSSIFRRQDSRPKSHSWSLHYLKYKTSERMKKIKHMKSTKSIKSRTGSKEK